MKKGWPGRFRCRPDLAFNGPVVTARLTRQGLAFEAVDAEPVRLISLVLTPASDQGVQVQILGSSARLLRDPRLR